MSIERAIHVQLLDAARSAYTCILYYKILPFNEVKAVEDKLKSAIEDSENFLRTFRAKPSRCGLQDLCSPEPNRRPEEKA